MLSGFGGHFESSAVKNGIPPNNNPLHWPYYAEQISGTAFTAPRHRNQRTWVYRLLPSADHMPFIRKPHSGIECELKSDPNQLRWSPPPTASQGTDFVDGLVKVCGAGNPETKSGLAVYTFSATADMQRRAFQCSDGDLLIVPYTGKMTIVTEMGIHFYLTVGKMELSPGEIAVVQRGIRFRVHVNGTVVGGYVLEVYNSHFELPDLGPIGANGLANPRDFLHPTAWFEDVEGEHEIVNKYLNETWVAKMKQSPFNVVAWSGNYVPYKYDLSKFNTINTVSFDHPDPSIFTVLTAKSNEAGVAVADFVIFPPRWMVAENTFRPPYFHRNCMSEYMGLIRGKYDAKEGGFVPGGASLHSIMTPHGPDRGTYEKTVKMNELKPEYFDGGLAFMFETMYMMKVSDRALNSESLQKDYLSVWNGFKKASVL